jgi:hypothetical protein
MGIFLQAITNKYFDLFYNSRGSLPAGDLFKGVKADPQSLTDKAIDRWIWELKHAAAAPHPE